MGFYFKMLDQSHKVCVFPCKTSVTYKSLGHCRRALVLGRITVRLQMHKEGMAKRLLINDNQQLFGSLYLFPTLDWRLAQRKFAIISDQFMNDGWRYTTFLIIATGTPVIDLLLQLGSATALLFHKDLQHFIWPPLIWVMLLASFKHRPLAYIRPSWALTSYSILSYI